MRKLSIYTGLLCAVAFSSCNYLDRDPLDAIGKEQFFETANAVALEQYCNNFYPKLIVGYGAPKSYDWGMLGEDFTSDDVLTWNRNTTSFGLATIPASASGTQWNWENIRACNDFLENYKLSPEADEVKQVYAGMILFFKTLDYFNKVKTYGDVPWFENVMNPGDEEMYKARDSRVLVMDNMLRDINQAITWLPKRTQGDVERISKDAALALKARMCLFEGTWRKYHNIENPDKFLQEAYNAACELMKPEYGYELYQGDPETAYHELFCLADQSNNKEVILAKAYDPGIDKGNNLTRQIYVGETPLGMSKNCADSYLCATTGKPISLCGCSGHTTHTTLIDELKNRDPRMLQTTATPDGTDLKHSYYMNGKAPNIATITNTGNSSKCSTGYPIVKFYNAAEYSAAHYQGTEDAPVFRLGEIMLIRAEAAAELGTITQTDLNETINKLRERVGFNHDLELTVPFNDPVIEAAYPNVSGTYAALIREIRRERRIEMFAEGVRYDDIRRWACGNLLTAPRLGIIVDGAGFSEDDADKLKNEIGVNEDGALTIYEKRYAGQTPTPVFEAPKHYLSPIPTDEIGKAPNIKQNEGWVK